MADQPSNHSCINCVNFYISHIEFKLSVCIWCINWFLTCERSEEYWNNLIHEIFQVQKERLGEWVLSLYFSYCPKSRPICLMIPTIGISKKHLDFLADHCE